MIKGIYEFISEPQLKKYAELAVRAGVNLQKNQLLIIHSDIQNAPFARLIQTVAYEAGASNVFIDWTDEQSTKEFYLNAADSVIDHFPDWQAARFKEWDDAGAAYIHIISENLDVFKEVSTERVNRFQKASRTKLKDYHAKIRSHKVRWCLLAVPCVEWAAKVFPNLSKEEALHSLWKLILKGSRADRKNPIKDWESHNRAFESRKKILNESQFEALHFTNSRGTDLFVGLPENHLYIGGGVIDEKGIPFFPNIPTEEIFTAPHKSKVNGKLVGSKPLIYEGSVIDEFYLIFKDGRITDYYAAKGQEVLQNLIETDEGSHYLGEIALVSNKSPLAQADTLFYNTLFDENTSCHIGIGNASPSSIQNGMDQSEKELKAAGLNTSLLLVNVTFGTKDMKVLGIKEGGTEVLLMKDGDFQF
ncbi:Leucyl aminopeptidase (aminopeptidase T) [Halobacillus dabanensis]|uniref:Leucyl aminopeptidase (Aminopeptidase T) n=1 Tax=Halobacillus dabanensis TaxID=240302 RepID=A0A1I3YIK4_HALDA|nr:aminopeptidase [Halobacillus dabanensis]SFK31662.1 Leucyl aminopeptidase (aminopeptidase T) [Halobacillus dabanensis]